MPVFQFKPTVEIFRTNVPDKTLANKVISVLYNYFPDTQINFDLEDCDRILRVEGNIIDVKKVTDILHSLQVDAELLP
ncbi:hypothetical protein [Sinomicrobium weinanense]|uniref:Uncharacterized protein n=1 Tax=Sinomicrobium weinanense TaxID=2842200 RepID=A0A926JRE1_9FLAO|nr:hypothetical protein [Sinomicrobium weinanense]MBC9796110.1 hypothetical protein [Sinomicrobium weinanense]MBU3124779.1 hypothetical protein [Sinomicrobium weinanense]